jgi:hypothetical protein
LPFFARERLGLALTVVSGATIPSLLSEMVMADSLAESFCFTAMVSAGTVGFLRRPLLRVGALDDDALAIVCSVVES